MFLQIHPFRTLCLCLLLSTAHAQEQIPFAIETDRPNIVRSPYSEKYLVDVSDFKPGQTVLDPFHKKKMRVPLAKGAVSAPVPQAAKVVRKPEIARTTAKQPATGNTPAGPDAIIAKTLKGYIMSGAVNDPMASVAFYDTNVDVYFGKRNADRHFLLKDRKNHIRLWPSRRYELLEYPSITRHPDGTCEASVLFSFNVSNGKKNRKGTARSLIKMRPSSDRKTYRIFSVEEQKI